MGSDGYCDCSSGGLRLSETGIFHVGVDGYSGDDTDYHPCCPCRFGMDESCLVGWGFGSAGCSLAAGSGCGHIRSCVHPLRSSHYEDICPHVFLDLEMGIGTGHCFHSFFDSHLGLEMGSLRICLYFEDGHVGQCLIYRFGCLAVC